MVDANAVLSSIAQAYGLPPNALTDRSNRRSTRVITDALAAAAMALAEEGYSQRSVARILHRGRSTIKHHQHNSRFEVQCILEDYRRSRD